MIDLSKISGLQERLPASDNEIRNVEKEMDVVFPEEFKELLRQTNGFTTEGVVVIYGTEEISEINETLEVEENAKGYLAIGDDSGPTIFLLSLDHIKKEVLGVDCGYINPLDAEVISPCLLKWLDSGCFLSYYNDEVEETYNILLTNSPKGKLKDLLKIKRTLNLQMSSAELLKASKNLPFTIMRNVSYPLAVKYLEKLKELDEVLQLQSQSDELNG